MPRPHHRPTSARLYRTIAVGFSMLVVALAAMTLVLALARAEIIITPAREEKELKASVTVAERAQALPDTIMGTVATETVTLEAASPITEGKIIEDRAHGMMTVVNNYVRRQPLIATTRFVSRDGILFRSTHTVTVPAGGRITVNVRADLPGKKGEVPAGRFTIPGLWIGLQNQIYGETKAAMAGGERKLTIITQADLEKARAALAALQTAKLHELNARDENEYTVRTFEKINEKALTPVGREADAARMQGTFTLTTVTYDAEALAAYLAQQAALRFGSADQIALDAASLSIDHLSEKTAQLAVTQKVFATSRAEDLSLDPRILKGMKASEAERILLALPGVGDARVILKPGFLKRLPRLPDHIKITVTNSAIAP